VTVEHRGVSARVEQDLDRRDVTARALLAR